MATAGGKILLHMPYNSQKDMEGGVPQAADGVEKSDIGWINTNKQLCALSSG